MTDCKACLAQNKWNPLLILIHPARAEHLPLVFWCMSFFISENQELLGMFVILYQSINPNGYYSSSQSPYRQKFEAGVIITIILIITHGCEHT